MLTFLLNRRWVSVLPYIAITILCILVFIVSCREWNFIAEDYSILYRASEIENLKDFGKIIFVQANVMNLAGTQNPLNPSVKNAERYCFFDSCYRPGLLLTNFMEYHLFGLNAYLYHLFIVLLHIINSFLLFYIFKFFFKAWISFLCAIFFTFNATLIDWFSKIDTQQHQIDLLFFLLLWLFLMRLFSTSRNSRLLFAALGMMHLFCLSIRETFIITPLIILLLIPLKCQNRRTYLNKIFLIISVLSGATLIYLLMKQIYYPLPIINFSTHCAGRFSFHVLQSIGALKMAVFGFIQELYCMLISVFINYKVYFFCKNSSIIFLYKLIKNLFLLILGYLFLINERRKYIFFGIISIVLLSWTKWIGPCFGLRHYYEFLPFVCLILGILLQCNKYVEVKIYKYIIWTFFLPLILINCFTIMHSQQIGSKNWSNFSSALEKLKKFHHAELSDNPIIVLNTREFDNANYNVGIIEAVQLNFMHNRQPKILIDQMTPCLEDPKFKLFCKWVSEYKSKFITLLIWNKFNDEFDVKVVQNLYKAV